MNAPVRAHIWIAGRVQGVFFRQELSTRARSLSLQGWVRNTSDGRVEAVLQGNEDAVNSLIRWTHEGPSLAEVESVEISWEQPQQESDFGKW